MLRQFWYCGSKALKQIMISLLQQTFNMIEDNFGATIPPNFNSLRFWPCNHGFHKSVFNAFENALKTAQVKHLHELREERTWQGVCNKVRASVMSALPNPPPTLPNQQQKKQNLHNNPAEYDAEISAINELLWSESPIEGRPPVMSQILSAYHGHLQQTSNKINIWFELFRVHGETMTACVRHSDVANYVLGSQDVHQHHLEKTTEHARKICQQKVCAGVADYSAITDDLPLNPVKDFLNSFPNKIDLHSHWATDIPMQMDTAIVCATSAQDSTDVFLEVSGPLVFDHKLRSHILKHPPGIRQRKFMLLYFIMFPLTPVNQQVASKVLHDIDYNALYSRIPHALEEVAMGSLEPIPLQKRKSAGQSDLSNKKRKSAPAAHSAPGNSAQQTQPPNQQPNNRCTISRSYGSNVHLNDDSQTFDFRSWKSLL